MASRCHRPWWKYVAAWAGLAVLGAHVWGRRPACDHSRSFAAVPLRRGGSIARHAAPVEIAEAAGSSVPPAIPPGAEPLAAIFDLLFGSLGFIFPVLIFLNLIREILESKEKEERRTGKKIDVFQALKKNILGPDKGKKLASRIEESAQIKKKSKSESARKGFQR
eukprot:TRINITY_DN58321_c0_g1_i1.p1 TRINITY_DN58321_c0_g1~~TRINITY_DN58321_c0_g1_i1.p1  ORF type:complete len:165 (-),score=27.03 TRINITY_DN58321_c0_g1_i1:59-553(-)